MLLMILYGHYRGLLRMAVSLVALIAALALAHVAMPYVTEFVKNRTPVYGWIRQGLEDALLPDENPAKTEDEQELLANLHLPQALEELLIEQNTPDMYEALGVTIFTEYIGNYLAGLLIKTVGFALLFGLLYLAVQLVMRWLDIMARLPILSGMNQLAGAVLGGIEGLFFLWLLSLPVTVFSQSGWAKAVMAQIEASRWLTLLYHDQVAFKMVLWFVKGIW